jgi:hypothetical protein
VRPGKGPPAATSKRNAAPVTEAAKFVAGVREGRPDVPRVELAARLKLSGFEATDEYRLMRENAARELRGLPDGIGAVTGAHLVQAYEAIAAEIAAIEGKAPQRTIAELARLSGRPQIPGLRVVYLNPLGDPSRSIKWQYILVHQTEGPPGSAKWGAAAQFANPTKRGVQVWVETDGVVYWAIAEHLIPTQGDGANRNDNKYVDNSKTFRIVTKEKSFGIEFSGNLPDVRKPATKEQVDAWTILVRFLQERYRIPAENIYAHNWIDFKDHRYCEGCELATLARSLNYTPGQTAGR